jgi:hypothetical protein
MNAAYTYSHETNKFFIADCLVRFIDRGWALRPTSITKACISTSIVITTLVSKLELTCRGTAWTLNVQHDELNHQIKYKQE